MRKAIDGHYRQSRNQGYRYKRLEPWQLQALGLDFEQGEPEPVYVAERRPLAVDEYIRRRNGD